MSSISMKEYLEAVKEISSSTMDQDEKIHKVMSWKEKLMSNDELLIDLLTQSAVIEEPEQFLPQDINGFSLYRDPDKDFSMHVFVWAPHVPYPIHDHGSWGIVGLYRGHIEETKYRWLGAEDHRVMLEPKTPKKYKKGEVFYVLPLDEGPHSMRSLGSQTSISIHTYGRPIRKSMLRLFHPAFDEKGKYSFYYTYPLYVYRRMLALDALSAISEDAGMDLEKHLMEKSGNKVLVAALRDKREEDR